MVNLPPPAVIPPDNLSFQNSPTCDEWSATKNYIAGQKLGTPFVDITT